MAESQPPAPTSKTLKNAAETTKAAVQAAAKAVTDAVADSGSTTAAADGSTTAETLGHKLKEKSEEILEEMATKMHSKFAVMFILFHIPKVIVPLIKVTFGALGSWVKTPPQKNAHPLVKVEKRSSQ